MLFPALLAPQDLPKPTIVLVHGAFADASGWGRVIPILQKRGYPVIAVQEPLTSLDDDVAATRRAIARASGPVVLVGHSYGGLVVSSAAIGQPNVKALVYVAAIAPEKGEAYPSAASRYPAAPLAAALVPDAAGYLSIRADAFRGAFAADLPESETRIMTVTQKPIFGGALAGTIDTEPAWKTIPSWYIVATRDRAINPDLERFYAKRLNARTTEVASSHVPFLSHPKEVAKVIESAAESIQTP